MTMPEPQGDPIAVIIFLAFYFLPTLIALVRKHRNKLAIGVLNLILGWTVVAWLVALVWSFTTPEQKVVVHVPEHKR